MLLTIMYMCCYNVCTLSQFRFQKTLISKFSSSVPMKNILVLCLAVFALLNLASCNVYVDPNGNVVGVGAQPIRAGIGFLPRSPLAGGTIIAGGSIRAGLCGPGGPGYSANFGTRALPPQWGRVYPYGSCQSPGHPRYYNNSFNGYGGRPVNAFGGQGYAPQYPYPPRAPNPRVGESWQYPWTPPTIRPGCAGRGYGGIPVGWD